MYFTLKTVHVFCAVATVSGFALRAYWMATDSTLLTHRVTKIAPHVVDTVFLLSGIAMLVVASMNPFTQPWLLAKFAGLVAYIALGTIALRRGPTRDVRLLAAVAALAVFAYVVGVALSHSPASWLAAMSG